MESPTFRRPANNIYSLIMLGECREVFDFPLLPFDLNLPYSDVIVTASSCQTPLSTGLEVSRIDGGVLVVPIDDQRRGFHRVDGMLGWMMLELHVETREEQVRARDVDVRDRESVERRCCFGRRKWCGVESRRRQ